MRDHYSLEEWADFVRGVSSHTDEMRAHLATGCAACRQSVDFLAYVQAVAAADRQVEPPEGVVSAAADIYQERQLGDAFYAPLRARLVYDSLHEPVAAGMRAEDRDTRQMLYQAGDYFLDLRVEREREKNTVVLVGQVASKTDDTSSAEGFPVLLTSRGEVIATAPCNQFGEFQMEYRPARHLRLHVPLDAAGNHIEVSLGRLAVDDARGRH
jgi:hypothetical protein